MNSTSFPKTRCVYAFILMMSGISQELGEILWVMYSEGIKQWFWKMCTVKLAVLESNVAQELGGHRTFAPTLYTSSYTIITERVCCL